MKEAEKISHYFTGERMAFLIPLYQRKYAWEEKHCNRLFSDIEKIHLNNINSHFFGCIVSSRANEVDDDLLIIDGQQRITTISLIVLAGINAVKNGLMKCDIGNVDDYLNDQRNKYLVAKYRRGDRQIKLRPIDDDLKAYDALFTNDESNYVPAGKSGITKNYKLFLEKVSKTQMTFDEMIDAIDRLTIIDIRLERSDNPQLIFESLNSCGKDLQESDKVRNYLLMSLTSEEQEDYYRKYWRMVEENTNLKDVYTDVDDCLTMFIRDYLTVKTATISKLEDMYFDFKAYDETNNIPREELLKDLLRYSVYFRNISLGEGYSKEINQKFKQLSYIGSLVCMPYYMNLLRYAEDNDLDDDIVYEVLDTIENYWARRIICGYPANVMQKTFATMHNDAMRIVTAHERRNVELTVSYAELIKYILLKKQGISIFPNDGMVKDEFPKRQVYRLPIKYRYFLFERMENLDSKERNDSIVEKLSDGDYSFEHIMPQTLTPEWKSALGENYEEIHEKYLHTFANLTLTAYNSNYGNHPFIEKKEGYIDKKGNKIYGFKDSVFKLSNYLKTINKWTLTEILERENKLLDNFLYLWPMIKTEYIPLEKDSDLVSFDDDDFEPTNRLIQSFTFRGQKHDIDSWKAMLVALCKLVYEESPSKIEYLCSKDDTFHDYEAKIYSKIAENCYVWTAASSKSICNTIRYMFKECGISRYELVFNLVPEREEIYDEMEE